MVKKYTLVTVETPSGWLLINRTNPPYRGMCNTLGGKFLPDETPAVCAARELQEESHIIIPAHELTGVGRVFWHVDGQLRGELYAFFGKTDEPFLGPQATGRYCSDFFQNVAAGGVIRVGAGSAAVAEICVEWRKT